MRQPRHTSRCVSNRARSTGGRAPSRYSVMSSTSSLHVSSWAASCDRPLGPNRSNIFIHILLHRSSNLASGPMQEDSLVGLGDFEDVTDLPGAPALDVPQCDHLSLVRGEGVDGLGRVIARFMRMRKTHVFRDERPSNLSNPWSTASQASCATSSATARLGT